MVNPIITQGAAFGPRRPFAADVTRCSALRVDPAAGLVEILNRDL
jgi:hypothetical protein